MARRRSPDEDARLRLDVERRLKYGLPEWIDRELRFAKDLAALEAARHYSAVCCASLSEYMRRLGYRGITAAAQARLGKAILKNPALEEKVRSGTIRIECAEAIAPMISEPDLAGKTDWMAEATRRAPGSLRAEVHRRLEEVVQRETQLFLLRLYVPWKAHEDFSRAVEVASTKAKEALTHGLAFERVVNDYLDRNDPLRRATKALRELEAEKKAREGGTSDASRSKASLPFGEAGSSEKTVPAEPPVAPPAVPATTPDPSVLTPEEQRVIDGMYADYIGGGQAAADRLYADVYGSPGKRPQEAISSSAAPSPDPGTSDSGVPCAASAGAEAPDAVAVAAPDPAPDPATPERALTEALGIPPRALGMRLLYDVCHNIAKKEVHTVDGVKKKVCVHRKGATRAFPAGHPDVPAVYREVGQPVLIPGDMGRCSYILVGTEKAMEETFGSTCHGAGRLMSRTQAIKQSRGRAIAQEMEQRGVIVMAEGRATLAEEVPEAYKDVSDVVEVVHQAGISRKVARLRPLGVIKG